MVWLAILAATLGAVPLLYLSGLRRRGHVVDSAWWWMGAGFGVSFVADVAGALGWHPIAQQVYPISQAALFVFPMLTRRAFAWYVAALLALATLSILARAGIGYDLALRAGAWGGMAAVTLVAFPMSRVRLPMAAAFAVMLGCWMIFTVAPTFWAWGLVQGVRVAGIALWCHAAVSRAK